MSNPTTLEQNLAQLKRDGFLLIPQALDLAVVEQWKKVLYDLYAQKRYEISNGVGNVAFEKLLQIEPEMAKALIGHPSTSPYLRAILGKQCQLRSLRAHVNPGAYTQEWHMDFYDYYYQAEKAAAEQPSIALCMNATFYLTDNTPDHGRLTFVKGYLDQPVPDYLRPNLRYTEDRNDPFQRWCDEQNRADLHPMAGIKVPNSASTPMDKCAPTSFCTISKTPCSPVSNLSATHSLHWKHSAIAGHSRSWTNFGRVTGRNNWTRVS